MFGWILATGLIFGASAQAASTFARCDDEAALIYVVDRNDLSGTFYPASVIRAELASLNDDGTASVIPCRTSNIKKVKQRNVFQPIYGRIDGRLVMGANGIEKTILTYDTTLFIFKKFRVQKTRWFEERPEL